MKCWNIDLWLGQLSCNTQHENKFTKFPEVINVVIGKEINREGILTSTIIRLQN